MITKTSITYFETHVMQSISRNGNYYKAITVKEVWVTHINLAIPSRGMELLFFIAIVRKTINICQLKRLHWPRE